MRSPFFFREKEIQQPKDKRTPSQRILRLSQTVRKIEVPKKIAERPGPFVTLSGSRTQEQRLWTIATCLNYLPILENILKHLHYREGA